MSRESKVHMFLSPEPIIQDLLNYVLQPTTTIFIAIMESHKQWSQANREVKGCRDKNISKKKKFKFKERPRKTYLFFCFVEK